IGRFCSPLDWTDNAAGGLIGVAAAVALTHASGTGLFGYSRLLRRR
ncbi:MAG: hypothetical protein QOD41_2274, partial [Cryptosporangiaceae bacterium]|nr:hypothetical protein [Cryptosporangiaceae bacterium]